MPVQSFDETSLANGPVPNTGSRGGSTPPSPPSATGRPSGVATADGTDNKRADQQTKQAAIPSTPSGSQKIPAGVDHYKEGL